MSIRIPATIIFMIASLLHSSALLAQTTRKLEAVTLGLSAKHVLNLPIYLAQRHGIFESEGFDYKPITTKTNTAIAALVSGDLDYITAFNSGLSAALGGAPLVAGYISTLDVTQGMVALFSGTVAAATLSPPYDSIAVRKGYNRLVLGSEVLPRFVENGLVMRRAKLRDNPDQVRRFLRAMIRGLHFAMDHPSESVALIQKDWNLDRETAQTAYDAALPTYNLRGEVSDELIAALIKRAQQDAKITESKFAPKDFVDWNIVRGILREVKR
ncbi:MAG: ABC transporter substrate-binding protein [Deltaproteobacteria bacterium]|nr:ABC transporter substrate-binding protein [Deltaproteobacteria bacterium]